MAAKTHVPMGNYLTVTITQLPPNAGGRADNGAGNICQLFNSAKKSLEKATEREV